MGNDAAAAAAGAGGQAQAAGGVASLLDGGAQDGAASAQGAQGGQQQGSGQTGGWWTGDAFRLSDEKPAEGLSNADWLANKKFASFEDAVKSYRTLEQKFGASKLAMPAGPDDAAAFDAIAKALGRPDDPKGYDIPLPEGDDGSFAEEFRPIAHKLRLSQEQVAGLAGWFNTLGGEGVAQSVEAARAELTKEWGGEYKANAEYARRAATAFGVSDEVLEQIAGGMGLAPALRLFAKIGRATGEAGGLVDGGRAGFGKSAAQMQARKTEIMQTPELAKKLMDGDPALKAEWDAIAAAEVQRLNAEMNAA